MRWLQLTQANTGVKVFVNMELVVLIAPTKTGGSALVTNVMEKETARVVPVTEAPQRLMELLGGGAEKA